MFNFRSDLSQLPSLHFLLISFTYVTVIKGVHLSFLIPMKRTGIYTGALHKAPLTGPYHPKQTSGKRRGCAMEHWTIFQVLLWILNSATLPLLSHLHPVNKLWKSEELHSSNVILFCRFKARLGPSFKCVKFSHADQFLTAYTPYHVVIADKRSAHTNNPTGQKPTPWPC